MKSAAKQSSAVELFMGLRDGRISRREFGRRSLALGVSAPLVLAALEACSKSEPDEKVAADSKRLESKLHLFIWSDYIADEVVTGFEKEFGVEVTLDTYESNEEMEAKLFAGGAAYDLCVPAGYTVARLIAAGLLKPLDRSRLPNFVNLDPLFCSSPWDQKNEYTVPYQWGMCGIAFRADKLEIPPDSMSIFQDNRYQRKMTMMDDAREVIGSMLKWKGESLNCRDASKLEIAKQDAITAKRNLRAYMSAQVKAPLISGEVWVAQLWNGDAAQARSEESKVEWVLPKEGGTLWSDSLVIPAVAKHGNAAHAFIDYVLRPDIGAAVSRFTRYGTPNQAAQARLENPIALPSEQQLGVLEYQVDLERDQAIWDRMWNEIKLAAG